MSAAAFWPNGSSADAASDTRLVAVAAGFPEYVSAQDELTSHEVLRWTVQPSVALSAAFAHVEAGGIPVVVESDVRLGARGELAFGASADSPSSFYVSLGTGLSSVLVVESQIWAGARGEAIALGEHTIAVPGFSNLESYCSGAGIEARYSTATGRELTGAAISERAAHGDEVARSILETAGLALGEAVANIVHVLDPHTVVLGGGLGAADNLVTAAAKLRYALLTSHRDGAPVLVHAQLDHRSALLGGAAAAWAAGIDHSRAAARPPEFLGETTHD